MKNNIMLKRKLFTTKFAKDKSKELRNNMTLSEILLWNQIKSKKLGVTFHRQIAIGNYIVDFYCGTKNLVVEVDGESHNSKEQYDKFRQEYLESLNLKVIRIDDLEVKRNMEGVLNIIQKYIDDESPFPRKGVPN